MEGKLYNAVLLIMAVINLVVVAAFSFFYERKVSALSLVLTLIASVLWLYREYHLVAFRLNINYVHIVITNLVMVLGYLLGYLLFRVTGQWQFIYILGNLLALLFIFAKSNLWREPIQISKDFRKVSSQTALLFMSNMLTRLTTYADKLLIFPILGGVTVSVYYAATLFGKVVSLAITPISSVMLSYLSKVTKKNDSTFKLAFFSSTALSSVHLYVRDNPAPVSWEHALQGLLLLSLTDREVLPHHTHKPLRNAYKLLCSIPA